jgi:hypothetical protein
MDHTAKMIEAHLREMRTGILKPVNYGKIIGNKENPAMFYYRLEKALMNLGHFVGFFVLFWFGLVLFILFFPFGRQLHNNIHHLQDWRLRDEHQNCI